MQKGRNYFHWTSEVQMSFPLWSSEGTKKGIIWGGSFASSASILLSVNENLNGIKTLFFGFLLLKSYARKNITY